MPNIEWRASPYVPKCWDAVGLPLWKDGLHPNGTTWTMWIQARPAYCNRGRFVAGVNAPIDHQDGFPRYYFSLDVAKSEMQAWVEGRKELR